MVMKSTTSSTKIVKSMAPWTGAQAVGGGDMAILAQDLSILSECMTYYRKGALLPYKVFSQYNKRKIYFSTKSLIDADSSTVSGKYGGIIHKLLPVADREIPTTLAQRRVDFVTILSLPPLKFSSK
uniref:Uncharacterized protein n=1 Tax=Magallana gigas TaxID=29159 RepID=K1R1T4_MAGGI